MPRISIIVPIYNTREELLDKCLKSIENQTMDDYEVILIDDGSKKSVRDYLKKRIENSSQTRLLCKENGGAASARRMGLSVATGDYVAFVDSDDEILPIYLEQAFSYIERGFDVVIGGLLDYYKGSPMASHSIARDYCANSFDAVQELLEYYVSGGCPKKYSFLTELGSKALVSKLYRRELFKDVDALNNDLTFGEDVLVNVAVLSKANSLVISSGVWYRRNINIGSTSFSYHPNGITEAFETTNAMNCLISNNANLIDACRTLTLSCLNVGMESQVFHPDAPTSFWEKRNLLRDALKEPMVQEACMKCQFDQFERSGTWILIRFGVYVKMYSLVSLVYLVRNNRRWK